MDTGRLSLTITIENDCSSIKFKGECDGDSSYEQNAFAAAIYAAVTDIVENDDTFNRYLDLADEMAEVLEKADRRKNLKLVH